MVAKATVKEPTEKDIKEYNRLINDTRAEKEIVKSFMGTDESGNPVRKQMQIKPKPILGLNFQDIEKSESTIKLPMIGKNPRDNSFSEKMS